jgi:hypothetical protein
VTQQRLTLWIVWAALFAALALVLALPLWIAPRPEPWNASQVAVANFVLSILALVGGIGSFAIREALALRDLRSGELDPTTPSGFAQLRRALFVLWTLCLGIGMLGFVPAHGAAQPSLALPYLAGAALLFFLHAPRAGLFERTPQNAPAGSS